MSIEINESILGIWYVSWDGADWMAGAWQNEGAPPEARHRFRYYKDEHAFDSTDAKSWYDLKPEDGSDATKELLIAALSEMATFIQLARNGKKWELIRGASTLDQFFAEFTTLPFVHAKTLELKDCRIQMQEHGTDVTVTLIHKETGRRASATGPAARKEHVRSEALGKLAELLCA